MRDTVRRILDLCESLAARVAVQCQNCVVGAPLNQVRNCACQRDADLWRSEEHAADTIAEYPYHGGEARYELEVSVRRTSPMDTA